MRVQATRNMAELASEMRHIRSFLHVSTAYVNCFLGRGVHVEERRYPVQLDGRRLAHAEVAAELASMAPDVAERKVSSLAMCMVKAAVFACTVGTFVHACKHACARC